MSRRNHFWLRIFAITLALLALALAYSRSGSDEPPVRTFRQTAGVAVFAPSPGITTLAPLFAPLDPVPGDMSAGVAGDGPPQLIGIAGRLPDDVEALVRSPEGGTLTLRVGQSAFGWTLISVTADRAMFDRGGTRQVSIIGLAP